MTRFKSKLHLVILNLPLVFLPWRTCWAQTEGDGGSSFLGAVLTLFTLLVLGGGIFLTLKIYSLLKGGELSSAWVFTGVALLILLISTFFEFLVSLGVMRNQSSLVFVFQLLGFILLFFGLVLIRKKLS